jgi:hypothetical protein
LPNACPVLLVVALPVLRSPRQRCMQVLLLLLHIRIRPMVFSMASLRACQLPLIVNHV